MPGYVRAADRREQLLDAAVDVLVRDGLEALTLRDVAAQAGVRLSTLQYIFSSRTELVAALSERVLTRAGLRAVRGRVRAVWTTSCGASSTGSPPSSSSIRRWWNWSDTSTWPGSIRRDPEEHDRLPGRAAHRRPAGLSRRFLEIAEKADEEYDRPAEALARMWSVAQMGLVFEALEDLDVDRYRADALFFVDRIVDVARPRPRPHPRGPGRAART